MDLTLHVWRQKNPDAKGRMVTYPAKNISPDASFLEMLDVVNEELIHKGEDPIAFDHDCREGICGMCSLVINGVAHGPERSTTTCQLHMRHFNDGDHIYIEPWRARAFPVIKDLVVDRSAFDRIIQSGGFVSVNTGGAPDANMIPIPKSEADVAFEAAACIGCGACVAACKNALRCCSSPPRSRIWCICHKDNKSAHQRVLNMIGQMDEEGFGSCTNMNECEAVCPKDISVEHIATLNREYLKASLAAR